VKFRDKPCACEQSSDAGEIAEGGDVGGGEMTPAAGGILANA